MTFDPKPRDRDPRGPGLALVGYRGTGKTTVGKILADRLNLRFLDADLELEARAERSIVSIFAESGEPVFRDWEEARCGNWPGTIPRRFWPVGEAPCCDLRIAVSCAISGSWSGCGRSRPNWSSDSRQT